MSYTYQPLQSRRHIRILRLRPALSTRSLLRCSIHQICLDDPDSHYEAVSYTWGAADYHENLRVDKALVLPIRKNLSAALRKFRLPRKARDLWVDAICINQDDNDEKGTQIPLMTDIYFEASSVLIWLGDSPVVAEAMELITSAKPRSRLPPDQGQLGDRTLSQALEDLTSAPWFGRRWIIQEAVSNAEVTLFCRSAQMSWPRLLREVGRMNLLLPESSTASSLVVVRDLWASRALGTPEENRFRLLDILHDFDHFDCTDARDRVFALASLAGDVVFSPEACDDAARKEGPDLVTAERLCVLTDCSLSAEAVFSQLAVEAIRAGCLPWVLKQAEARRNPGTETWPTWVPDWGHGPPYQLPRPYEDRLPIRFCQGIGNGKKVGLDLLFHLWDGNCRSEAELPTAYWVSPAFPDTDDLPKIGRWACDTAKAFVALCVGEASTLNYEERRYYVETYFLKVLQDTKQYGIPTGRTGSRPAFSQPDAATGLPCPGVEQIAQLLGGKDFMTKTSLTN